MSIAELKTTQKLNEYEFGVSIALMRNNPNNNNWSYQNLEKYYKQFAGRPILIAYVNGRIGLGHEMKERVDEFGQKYYSFTDGTSERIVGTISDDPNDIWLEDKEDGTWVMAKGKLFSFYAKELVDELIKRGSFEVSVETEVTESHMDGNIEVFTEWTPLAVTILGSGVAPAIPGANIKQLKAIESDFRELKLKVASMINAAEGTGTGTDDDDANEDEDGDGVVDVDDPDDPDDPDEPDGENDPDDPDDIDDETDDLDDDDDDFDGKETQKPQTNSIREGGKTLKVFHKKEIAEIAKNFADKLAGYTVLSAGQDETGIHLCLMSADGTPASYSMESFDEVFDGRKIQRMNASVAYKFGEEQIDIDVCDYTDTISAKLATASSELETTSAELKTAQETIEAMKAAEQKRRVSAAKAAAKATLDKFNENRDEKVEEEVIASVNEAIDNGEYTECMNGEGEWCGEEAVSEAVLAKCAKEVMKYDAQHVARNSAHYIWGEEGKEHDSDNGGVGALLASWKAKKIN